MIKLQILLFSFMVPREFNFFLGVFSVSAYRLILILLLPYVLFHLLNNRFKWRAPDIAVLALSFWPLIAYTINTNISTGIESGGILFLELFVPYFLTRIEVKSYSHLKSLSNTILVVIALLCISAIPESIYGKAFIHEYASQLTGNSFSNTPVNRFGIWRAYGPTDHPIILGAICSIGIVISLVLAVRQKKYIVTLALSIIGVITAASSAPLLSAVAQLGLVSWSRLFSGKPHKWLLLIGLILFAYVIVDIASNRDPFRVMFSYLLFNTGNGYVRYYMWSSSMFLSLHEWQSALFGFGLSTEMFALLDTEYMQGLMTRTVDSYWLVLLLRFGWPMLIIYWLTVIAVCLQLTKSISHQRRINKRRLIEAWLICVIAFSLIAFTVHFWAQMTSLYMIILAAGLGIKYEKKSTVSSKLITPETIKERSLP
jgi:hypothetical protein